jgi:hypothetical protein
MATKPRNSVAKMFGRIWYEKKSALTPTLARHVLKLGFTDEDRARMRELLERNRDGTLTPNEAAELDGYDLVGDMLSILQSKARMVLRKPAATRNGHG